ncbi:MAG: SDR family NAD(P)-dependent oxidoreductase [Candidatus Saganbacteria bacterium]|nr:SDR family NAD(P)-dependent oxidoreductase [Candidatus Saganbacteria bacterium]
MDIKNKRVIVTGADGFIGSHLVEALLDEGAKVKAFCFYNSFNSYGWLDSLPKEKVEQIEIFTGDIRDPYGVRTALKNVDVVFHLAALIGIPYSYHSPDNYVDTNIKGTLNILQAARDLAVEKVLVTSTSEVYGTALYVPIDEKHPLQPQSPYSATKIGADSITESFYCSFDLPVTLVRPFNTYGPRQSARAIIPTIISQIIKGKNQIKLGNLSPTRDLTFVKDTAAAFIAIAKTEGLLGETVNIGMNKEIAMGDLVKLIASIMNKEISVIEDFQRIRPKKSEVERLCCNNSKILKKTNWRPQYDLKKGLKETIDWIENKMSFYKTEMYNV